MNLSKLSAVLAAEPKYRYAQINQALWQDYISAWDQASNLPQALREKLDAQCPLAIKAEVFQTTGGRRSDKALITLGDGETIETVLIRQKGKEAGRNTVCVSSQAGCPLRCAFCATGQAGFRRNLQSEEIVEQVVFWARYLKSEAPNKTVAEKIDNIVFMGMGEPFLNYVQFIKAVKFLNNPETLNIGARRMSVSTSGIIEGIKRLAGEKIQMNLAISLHATTDEKRRIIMPIANKYSLPEIFQAVDNYILKTGRRVMFEYLLMKGVNDSDEEARELATLMAKPLYMVNLIPYNAAGGKFHPSDRSRIDAFQQILDDSGVPTTVRLSFGSDIGAACGQLRGQRPLGRVG
jgi:23S rRNA (adenine2503-C2)-methyltransferase